jgi:hypothetical protein
MSKKNLEAIEQSENDAARIAAMVELEGMRKDAERYRWIRDKSESVHSFYLSVPIWFSNIRFRKEDVDSAIDAAIAEDLC